MTPAQIAEANKLVREWKAIKEQPLKNAQPGEVKAKPNSKTHLRTLRQRGITAMMQPHVGQFLKLKLEEPEPPIN